MKTALVRLLVLALPVSLVGLAMGQTPTPFGTPSLLPVQDHYANWQTHQIVHPAARGLVPASAPHYSAPHYGAPHYGTPTQTYPATPRVPLQYATTRMQTPAAPQPPHSPSVVQPHASTEDVASPSDGLPEIHGSDTHLYGRADDSAAWGYGSGCVAGSAVGCADACVPVCEPCCVPCYYAGVGGLLFTRNRPRFHQISFDDTDLVGQVLSTDTGLGRWDFGGQAHFGWYLNPAAGCALELGYWGIYGDQVQTTVLASNLVGNLNTVFDFSPLNIGATNVNDLFDAAQSHLIRRDYDLHNVEVTLLGGRYPCMTGSCFQVSYLAGFRYLRFSEDFFYASADASPSFGADPANEAYYDINVRNNLWGFQLGSRADWYVTPCFSLHIAPKFGLYANYMEHHSRIYNANGTAVVGPGNPLVGELFDIDTDKTIASFIGEIDLGLDYQFTSNLAAGIGYRAVAISGLAYATDQIPSNFADLPGVGMIDSNADMVLHGGYASVTLTW
jgi:hypothetical protein